MPLTDVVFLSVVVLAFVSFAVTLGVTAWRCRS